MKTHIPWYDRQGNLIETMEEVEVKLRDMKYKRVAYTWIPFGKVSTVWLGLDHGYLPRPNAPIIFETMVFPSTGYTDLYMDRYSTEKEAWRGHWKAVLISLLPIPTYNRIVYCIRDIADRIKKQKKHEEI